LPGIILLNKPYGVLSQFTDRDQDSPRPTLADFLNAPRYRVAGRLDHDSEGLLVLTNSGHLQQRIANPKVGQWKRYWVQVEGTVTEAALTDLRNGLSLKDGMTLPARACAMDPPAIWPRDPPVRYRATVPDSWLEIQIREGRNRQIRRMTAAVGLPTLRLVRVSVGEWQLENLVPGQYRFLSLGAAS
jgi:23S rRNA pseudouridine2457 synthase